MQVEGFFRTRARLVLFVAGCGSALMMAGAGCHRAPAPDVVATVNGKDIMRGDLEKLYKASLAGAPQQPSPQQADIARLNLLRNMIDDEILQQRAAKMNLSASDEDVNARLTEMKAPYTQDEFDRRLAQSGMTLDDLKRQIRHGLTTTKLQNKEIESKINITDADIASYFNSHKSEFNLIEPQYRLAQIVVTGNPPSQAAGQQQGRKAPNEAEAHKEIQTLHNRLESGDDFSTLAGQFSENANFASNGGDMGFVAESSLRENPDIFAAVSKLKPGQITDALPIYDGAGPGHKVMGYAIYKLIAREAAGQRDLSDPSVQQNIRQGLRDSRAQLLKNAYYETLHDQAKIQNYFAEQILKQAQ